MRKLAIGLILLVLMPFSVPEASAQPEQGQGDRSTTHERKIEYVYGFEIYQHCIKVPLSKYLLIRNKNGEYGAIKILTAQRSEKKEAVYEWWFGIDHNGRFTNKDSKHGIGKASFKFLPVYGRVAFQTGNPRIKFESIKLSWSAPTWVYFYDNDNRVPVAELSPTNESEIQNISVFDPKIKWYQMDPFLVNYKPKFDFNSPR